MLLTEYRLDLVIQALRTILPLEHPADTSLRYFFKQERIGSNERALVAETVFGVLRHRLFLEQACFDPSPTTKQSTPRRVALAYWVRFGGYNLRELEPLLKRDEAVWLGTVKAIAMDKLSLAVQAELPEWVIESLRPTMSDADILALGRSMQQPAALDLRVNTVLATRDEVLQALLAEGMDVKPHLTRPSASALRINPHSRAMRCLPVAR